MKKNKRKVQTPHRKGRRLILAQLSWYVFRLAANERIKGRGWIPGYPEVYTSIFLCKK